MIDFRVPTRPVSVEVCHADGRVERGSLFLPTAAPTHPGAMQLDEWLNEHPPFFPFRPTDSDDTVLLNGCTLVAVTVHGEEGVERAGPNPEVRSVEVECGSRTWRGELLIDEEQGHRRVQDYLNRSEPFLVLREHERTHLVRKSFVTRVTEAEGRSGVSGKAPTGGG